MSKIKNIIQSIRIEEYILLFFSLILFLFCLALVSQSDFANSFRIGFDNVALGVNYFSFVLFFIYFYIFFKLYLYLINWLSPFIEKEDSLKNVLFSWPKLFSQSWPKLKNFLITVLFFLRPLFFVTLFFSLITYLIGLMAVQLRGNLIDGWLMKIDKSILGFYPFLWSNDSVGFLEYLAPLFLYAFCLLGSLMGISWLILYLMNQRRLFSQFIIAMTLVTMLALPIWFFFPANSPQNTYLNNVYSLKIDPFIENLVKDYQPNQYIINFHQEVGVNSGGTAPVTTMPSMHVAWTIIIVYYLFKFKRKTIYFTLPWAFFSILGTVYLAQHYFIDILVALPITLLAIWLTNYLVMIEEKYYREENRDKLERISKERIKKDLALIPRAVRFFYPARKAKSS